MSARLIPLMSVFAAFAFVIMMFNVPLPGGTTGHAVGVGVAAIVLGPWGAIVAISVALFIQALFFGDGGITTFGANCFNMAIVGSLVSYGVYRLIAGRMPGSSRRIVGSAIAGYLAINSSALLASIEFGIQPMLFRSATGVPLYAPYPLSIALPAMMIGHLTFAGLAESIVTAGVVAYLDRTFPALLGAGMGAVTIAPQAEATAIRERVKGMTLRLGVIVGILLMLTPLGLLAAGSAWGEWSPSDFSDQAARVEITAASRDHAPPAEPPAGLLRLARIWTAPMSHYAPTFMKSAGFGYMLSAMTGCGLIVLACLSLAALTRNRGPRPAPQERPTTSGKAATASEGTEDQTRPLSQPGRGARTRGFLERNADAMLQAFEYSLRAESLANKNGLLQRIDPRVKVIGMFSLIVTAAMARNIETILALLVVAIAAAVLSHIPITALGARMWIGVFLFTGAIALPAIFITEGRVVARVPLVGWPVTAQGIGAAAYLLSRIETAATLAMLLVLSTTWPHLLKALRVLGVPALVVVVLSMSYRYSFLMLRTAHDMFESRRSRMVGLLDGADRRRLAAASAGVLLARTMGLAGEVYLAMVSRGFQGDAYTLDDFEMRRRDWLALIVFALIAALAVWFGHHG